MGVFDKLGGAMIANTIKTNVLKTIDSFVESNVINSLLPHATEDGTRSLLKVNADLTVTLAECEIKYIQHMGKDDAKTLQIPLTERALKLASVIPANRPFSMSSSRKLSAQNLDLAFSGTLDGIAFTQMMMGAGATIDTVTFRVKVTGCATGDWLVPEPAGKA